MTDIRPTDPDALRAEIAQTRSDLGDTAAALAAKADVKARVRKTAEHATDQVKETASHAAGQVKETASHAAGQVKEAASQAADQVKQQVSKVTAQAGDTLGQTRERVASGVNTVRDVDVSDASHEPLPAAAVAIAASAVVAIAVAIYLIARRRRG